MLKSCDVCGDTNKVWKNKSEGDYFDKLLCNKHRMQVRQKGYITDSNKSHVKEKRVCNKCGNVNDVIYNSKLGVMLCRKHYSQVVLYDDTLEKTIKDDNDYIEREDHFEIILRNVKKEEVARTKIDKEDFEKVKNYKWSLNSHGYARTRKNNILLHRLVLGENDKNVLIDHVDRNRLDNRKSNLRVANKSVNAVNVGLRASNKSGITGVSFNNQKGKWRAYLTVDKKRIELGNYKDIEKAIFARLSGELKYFGLELAPQKHLFKDYGIGE